MRIIRAILPAWAGLAAVLVAAPSIAADAETPPPETAPALAPGWTFSVKPFFWAAGFEGDVGVHGLGPVNVDSDFDQIFNHIDWWPPPIMLDGEARNGRYALFTEFIYLGLEAEGSSPGPLNISASEDMDLVLWTFGGSYRVVDNGAATLDVLAGGRLWSVHSDLALTGPRGVRLEDSDGKTWVDPVIGVAGSVGLGHGFGLYAEADVGGFGAAADIDWQVQGALQYNFNDSVTLEAGYRYLAVNYEDDGFVWDVSMQGPVIGLKFRF